MKSTMFRIGNIVTVCYEDTIPDTVLILEPGLVHLSRRLAADNENDIAGVRLTVNILESMQFEKTEKWEFQRTANNKTIKVSLADRLKISWLFIDDHFFS